MFISFYLFFGLPWYMEGRFENVQAKRRKGGGIRIAELRDLVGLL